MADDDALCLGCGRTLGEIAAWRAMPPARQRRVARLAAERLAAHEGGA